MKGWKFTQHHSESELESQPLSDDFPTSIAGFNNVGDTQDASNMELDRQTEDVEIVPSEDSDLEDNQNEESMVDTESLADEDIMVGSVGLGEVQVGDEFDAWVYYNEIDEIEAQMSDEERLQFIEEMLRAQQNAEIWEYRRYYAKPPKFSY
jgi:hypothetical protein